MDGSAGLVVVGSYVQDHVWQTERLPIAGETRRAHGFATAPGGKGFNQAVAAHRQGAHVQFIGALGDDPLGRFAQAYAREEGLPCRWQVKSDVATAAAGIIVDDAGRNQILVALGANESLDPGPLRDVLAGAALLVLQLENNLDAIVALVAMAGEAGVPVQLNPAPMHAQVDAALLSGVALLTPNESEFAALVSQLTGTSIEPAQVAGLSDDALHAYSRKLGVGTVVITLGEHGCFVSHGVGSRYGQGDDDRYRVPAMPVRPVDSTGAGDAFNGALAAALLREPDAPFRQAVEHANRVAAMSTETLGAAPSMPSLAQVVERFG
jgi:ribokinase